MGSVTEGAFQSAGRAVRCTVRARALPAAKRLLAALGMVAEALAFVALERRLGFLHCTSAHRGELGGIVRRLGVDKRGLLRRRGCRGRRARLLRASRWVGRLAAPASLAVALATGPAGRQGGRRGGDARGVLRQYRLAWREIRCPQLGSKDQHVGMAGASLPDDRTSRGDVGSSSQVDTSTLESAGVDFTEGLGADALQLDDHIAVITHGRADGLDVFQGGGAHRLIPQQWGRVRLG